MHDKSKLRNRWLLLHAKFSLCTSLLLFGASAVSQAADVKPLPKAHAHNDYLHDRPLIDALDNGFCSVEADIFLIEGQLLVAHTRSEIDAKRTLKRLYLDPLKQRVEANGGRMHKDGPRFTLLIDLKAQGRQTFDVLNDRLSEYPDVFSRHENGKFHAKAVDVIISGDRPKNRIASVSPRFAGIDGRLSDLNSDLPADLLPLISDNWRSHFRWRGEGPMPKEDQAKLKQVISKAHAKNRRVRFWATPDKPEVWAALRDAGADLINTDDLPGLSKFLAQ